MKKDEIKDAFLTDDIEVSLKDRDCISCCDCGLAHELKIRIVDGVIKVRFIRDNILTNENREKFDYECYARPMTEGEKEIAKDLDKFFEENKV